MLSKYHQIVADQQEDINACAWMNLHMPIHQKSEGNFYFIVIVIIYFLLPFPWRSQSPVAQETAMKAVSLLLTKKEPRAMDSRMGHAGGLGRVEGSNPGAFFFILLLGAVLGLTCPPVATAQPQAREQARNEAVSMAGGPVPRSVPGSLSYQHAPPCTCHWEALASIRLWGTLKVSV